MKPLIIRYVLQNSNPNSETGPPLRQSLEEGNPPPSFVYLLIFAQSLDNHWIMIMVFVLIETQHLSQDGMILLFDITPDDTEHINKVCPSV